MVTKVTKVGNGAQRCDTIITPHLTNIHANPSFQRATNTSIILKFGHRKCKFSGKITLDGKIGITM